VQALGKLDAPSLDLGDSDRLTTTSAPIDMALPIGQGVTGAAYRIISGFQLSPDELAVNRQAKGG